MGRHLLNILRGFGSVLELSPDPDREITTSLYERPESDEEAVGRYWLAVGGYLRGAMDSVDREQAQEESA